MRSEIFRFARALGRVRKVLFPRDLSRWVRCFLQTFPDVLQTRSLGPVDELFGNSFCVRFGSTRLHFADTSFGLIREIFGQHCYAQPKELHGASRILDLGANSGVFSVFALACAPRARVHAVEAQPKLVSHLKGNVSRNGFARRHQAEWAVVGGAWDDWTRQLMGTHPDLPVFDPEKLFQRDGDYCFCKCDVEGAEFQLLRQQPRWLARIRRLALEYHGDFRSGEELQHVLEEHGFRVRRSDHRHLGYLHAGRI